MPSAVKPSSQLDVTGFGLTTEDLPPIEQGPLNLAAWFDANATMADFHGELEIGSGKGTFLVQHAPRHPQVNFIGVEYARAFWRHAADRVRRHQLHNVRMLHAEAGLFVRQYVPDAAFEQVHIYFPDPWPKKRHHKRRLIQAPFLEQMHRILQPAGRVRLATDHVDYFAWMEIEAGKVENLFERQPFTPPDSAGENELVGSNFERKYREAGRDTFQGMILLKK